MKPSLEKHKGCDIIDLNPGPGIWSSALHEFLNPRTHIMMEPDHKIYQPLLQPLLDAEGSTYKLIPKSGVVWGFLQEVLAPEYLPHQKELDTGDPELENPNDTLLLVANLGYNPRKPYRGFPSVTTLFIHQLLSAIRAHSLVHKYGLVRMLIWVDDIEKRTILPRTIVNRKKSTIEAEISCSRISEVASSTDAIGYYLRDNAMDIESSIAAVQRMKQAGIVTTKARQGPLEMEAYKQMADENASVDAKVQRSFYKELNDLEQAFAAGEFFEFESGPWEPTKKVRATRSARAQLQTPEYKRMMNLQAYERLSKKSGKLFQYGREFKDLRNRYAAGEFQKFSVPESELPAKRTVGREPPPSPRNPKYVRLQYLRKRSQMEAEKEHRAEDFCEEWDAITAMQKEVLTLEGAAKESLQEEIDRRSELWREETDQLSEDQATSLYNLQDNRLAFYQEPPVLYWDRRTAEPLKVSSMDFFPRCELALLDFQPQSLWPIIRDNFPHNYDVFEYILSTLLIYPTNSVRQGLQALAPGALEWLVKECPSITDPNRGGNPDLDVMRVRCLTLEMYREILEAWMRWPWRPSRYELLSRMGSDVHDPDAEPSMESF
jgi:hypothetical protein